MNARNKLQQQHCSALCNQCLAWSLGFVPTTAARQQGIAIYILSAVDSLGPNACNALTAGHSQRSRPSCWSCRSRCPIPPQHGQPVEGSRGGRSFAPSQGRTHCTALHPSLPANLHALGHFAEHDMLAVQPASHDSGDEELASVGVRALGDRKGGGRGPGEAASGKGEGARRTATVAYKVVRVRVRVRQSLPALAMDRRPGLVCFSRKFCDRQNIVYYCN